MWGGEERRERERREGEGERREGGRENENDYLTTKCSPIGLVHIRPGLRGRYATVAILTNPLTQKFPHNT